MSGKNRRVLQPAPRSRLGSSDDPALLELVLQLMYDHAGQRVALSVEEISAELARRGFQLTPTEVGALWRTAIDCVLAGDLPTPSDRRRRAKEVKQESDDDEALTELILLLACRNAMNARGVEAELKRIGFDVCWQAIQTRITRARDDGHLYVTYDLETERAEAVELSHRMMTTLPIRRAIVVRGAPGILSANGRAERAALRRRTVYRAARPVIRELLRILTQLAESGRSSVRIGVSWGGTLARIVHVLAKTSLPRGLPLRIEVVPIVGFTGNWSHRPVEGYAIASTLARGLRTSFTTVATALLPAPAFVTREEYQVATRLTQVKSMLEEIRRCDVVITSVGPVRSAEGPDERTFSSDPRLNEAVFRAWWDKRAPGEVCGLPIAAGGAFVETEYRSVGIDYATLREMHDDPQRHVIVVACGDRTRIEPLRAVINGRLATTVITDSVMARELMEKPRKA